MRTTEAFNDVVLLDDGNSIGLEFTFMWTYANAWYEIIAPDGTEYNNTAAEYSILTVRKISRFTFSTASVAVRQLNIHINLLCLSIQSIAEILFF